MFLMLLFLFGSLSLKQLFMIQRICIAAYDLESFKKKTNKKTKNDSKEMTLFFETLYSYFVTTE